MGKVIGKKAGKNLSKRIPFLGTIASVGWFAFDIATGDFVGAAFDIADGIGSLIPPVSAVFTVLETACDTKDALKASVEISYKVANTGAQIAYAAADGAKTVADLAGTIKDGISLARDGKTLLTTANEIRSVIGGVF